MRGEESVAQMGALNGTRTTKQGPLGNQSLGSEVVTLYK